jgi:hypothetical protein
MIGHISYDSFIAALRHYCWNHLNLSKFEDENQAKSFAEKNIFSDFGFHFPGMQSSVKYPTAEKHPSRAARGFQTAWFWLMKPPSELTLCLHALGAVLGS